jgi:hypothetical protein
MSATPHPMREYRAFPRPTAEPRIAHGREEVSGERIIRPTFGKVRKGDWQ